MKSAKQLSKVLLDYQVNAISGGFSDSQQLAPLIKEACLNDPDAPPLAKFFGSFGNGEGIIAASRYWQFRDEINEYQKANNVSSVEWDSVEWYGETIRFPNYNDQLTLMPQDGAILSRHKHKTVAKYLDFISRHNLTMMIDRDDLDNEVYVDHSFVLKAAQEYDYAWLGHGWNNQPVFDGSQKERVILYYLTEHSIYLTDYPQDDGKEPLMRITTSVKTYDRKTNLIDQN